MTYNQFITEEVLGECWHEWKKKVNERWHTCKKCNLEIDCNCDNRYFTNPANWWHLMEFCVQKDWFDDFLIKSGFFNSDGKGNFILVHTIWLRDRKFFPESLAKFRGWREAI